MFSKPSNSSHRFTLLQEHEGCLNCLPPEFKGSHEKANDGNRVCDNDRIDE